MKKFILLLLFILLIAPAHGQVKNEQDKIIIDRAILPYSPYFSIPKKVQKEQKADNNVDFAPYMRKMQKKIQKHWHNKHTDYSYSTRVSYRIYKNGEASNIKIHTPSGYSSIDNIALRAIKESLPFEPLPKEYNLGNYIDVVFNFDFNVTKINASTSPKTKHTVYDDEFNKRKKENKGNISYWDIDELTKKYKKEQKNKVLRQWKYDKTKGKRTIKLSFLIDKKGNAYSIKINKSSKDKDYDKKAVNIIRKTKFEPNPNFVTFNPYYSMEIKVKLKNKEYKK